MNTKNRLNGKYYDEMFAYSIHENLNHISIILGEPGSVAAECLETYGKVIHITSSKYDIFSSKIWDNVKVKMIADDVYLYEKKSKQNFLNKGKNNNKLRYLI